jgi:hypothetical protein
VSLKDPVNGHLDGHQRRGDDDYVTREIDLGLRNGWTVIPVLLNDAPLPDGRDLPLAIKALPRHQVAHLRQASLDDDMESLIARLDELGSQPGVEEPPSDPDEDRANAETAEALAVPGALAADDDHYQMLADEADNLATFLGAGANADDRDGPFRPGTSMLPDDADIAEYLAVKARLKSSERQLAEVAQYARMIRGEPRVLSWVKSIFADSAPGPVHGYLARLPRRLEELGLTKRYQMIVTSKFDVALEQAFLEAKEPFDVAIYRVSNSTPAIKRSWAPITPAR